MVLSLSRIMLSAFAVTMSILYPISVTAQQQFHTAALPSVKSFEGSTSEAWALPQIEFFQKIRPLFEYLKIRESSAVTVSFLPGKGDEIEPNFDRKNLKLVLGPNQICPSGFVPEFQSSNLHEFSHSVFTPNLNIEFGLSGVPSPKESYNFMRAVLGQKEAEINKPVTILDLSGPFDELFADLVATIAMNDPDLVNQSTSKCTGKQSLRSFTSFYDSKNWDGGGLEPRNLLVGADFHEVLSPLRSILWNRYIELRQQGVRNAGGRVVAAFFRASISMIRELHTRRITYAEWFGISKESLNLKTAEKFRLEIQDVP